MRMGEIEREIQKKLRFPYPGIWTEREGMRAPVA